MNTKTTKQAAARVMTPNRRQMEFRASDLESLLPEGHRARLIWAYVERQNLEAFYAPIRAREGGSGRAAIAPEILLALWLYATLDSVGSAREIARLSEAHDAYRWLCGGVQINYHSVSDFRKDHSEALDELLSTSIASLMAVGAVSLKRVAQDGMRVRASAGASSFRRQDKLEQCLEDARAEVARLKAEIDRDPGQGTRQKEAAARRAADARQARLEAALAKLPAIDAIKARQGKDAKAARASMTDPDATVMKMGDGGFRPAYNPQLACDTESLVIVGLSVATVGSDRQQLGPMATDVHERTGSFPGEWLVDGGYVNHAQFDAVSEQTTIYAPVPAPKVPKGTEAGTSEPSAAPVEPVDPHQPKAGDSEAVAAWRVRMGTDEAKAIYKERAASIECINAHCRNRGLQQFRVRGLTKVTCVMTLFALAHNLMRMVALAPELIGIGTGTSAMSATGA
jgi:transposase